MKLILFDDLLKLQKTGITGFYKFLSDLEQVSYKKIRREVMKQTLGDFLRVSMLHAIVQSIVVLFVLGAAGNFVSSFNFEINLLSVATVVFLALSIHAAYQFEPRHITMKTWKIYISSSNPENKTQVETLSRWASDIISKTMIIDCIPSIGKSINQLSEKRLNTRKEKVTEDDYTFGLAVKIIILIATMVLFIQMLILMFPIMWPTHPWFTALQVFITIGLGYFILRNIWDLRVDYLNIQVGIG